MTPTPDKSSEKTDAFIARWQGQEGGQERANYALFLTELCDVLDLPHPDVAKATHAHNDYVFERAVQRHLTDGDAAGRIDLYKRNSFVLEAKQSRWKGGGKEIAGQNDLFNADDEQQDRGRRGASRAWDVLMLNAKRQAEEYARGLPPSIGRAGDIRRFPHLDRTGVAVHRVRLHKYRCDNVVAGTGAPADNAACPRLRDVCLTNCDNLSLQKDDGFRQIAIHSFIDWPSCTEGFVQEQRRTSRTLIMKEAQLFSDQCSSVVRCTVRDVSAKGACLQLATTIVLPNAFEMSFDSFHSARWCHLKWRADSRIGVSFEEKAKQ